MLSRSSRISASLQQHKEALLQHSRCSPAGQSLLQQLQCCNLHSGHLQARIWGADAAPQLTN